MTVKIQNQFLVAEINSFGAELYSLKSKKTGFEYLWQGNPEFWKNRATVLFPICGRLFGGKYYYQGKEYEMPLHGIAKLYDFDYKVLAENQVELTLKANEQTKESYPFDFELKMTYTLIDNVVRTSFNVKNNGQTTMPFSYGGHPGFNLPLSSDEAFEDYYVEFSKDSLERIVFSDTCFRTEDVEVLKLDDKKLHLKHNLFDNDALFFKTETDKVLLTSKSKKASVEVSYKDMTCLGLWHKPKTEAPYVCIEPWHGVPSDDGKVDDFSTKKQMIELKSNDTFENHFDIKIIEG